MAFKKLLIDIYNANPNKNQLNSNQFFIEIDKVINPHKYFISIEELQR